MYTRHAVKRTRERTGLGKEASIRLIQKAIKEGIRPEFFPTREREFLIEEQSKYPDRRILVYENFMYFLSDEYVCITMYGVPEWFGKQRYEGKMKIRDIKKYMRQTDLYNWSNDYRAA